jgi:hypothetical protein
LDQRRAVSKRWPDPAACTILVSLMDHLPNVRTKFAGLAAIVLVAAIALTGCQHRVVATGDNHTVKLYSDEATYVKLKSMRQEGGATGMLGGIGESLTTKELDNNTPIRIISSDSEGAQVEITDGPNKGAQGFVAKENVS